MLTGILRLNVWQMILGSTPFYFMVAPVVLSGSFVVKIYATAGVRGPRRRAAHACSPACAPAQTAEYFMWTSTGLVMGSVRHAPRASKNEDVDGYFPQVEEIPAALQGGSVTCVGRRRCRASWRPRGPWGRRRRCGQVDCWCVLHRAHRYDGHA